MWMLRQTSSSDYNLPVVTLVPALDGRMMQINYTAFGVAKSRYFVDNVEWTLTNLLNR